MEGRQLHIDQITQIIRVIILLSAFMIIRHFILKSGNITDESYNEITAELLTKISIAPVYGLSESINNDHVFNILSALNLPSQIKERITVDLTENGVFIHELSAVFNDDPDYWILIDKNNSLSSDYEPHDLVVMESNHLLRGAAYEALNEIINAAAKEGYTLTVISAYRSFDLQEKIYAHWAAKIGQIEADRVSARPGRSQHQLGLAVDFNMLNNSFAETPEGLWLAANANLYGWSLSYPDGYESVTGYIWESWHYRYVGKKLTQFINKYFNGIQQYALMFIHEFNRNYKLGNSR